MSNCRLHFPAKVYQIIEIEDPEIIRWEQDGKSFRIYDYGRFEKEIIPKYFRHGRIASVQRQLNLYGFKCVSRGEDKGSFFHPNFQRGQYDTVREIRRAATTGSSGNGNVRKEGSANKEDKSIKKVPDQTTAARQQSLGVGGGELTKNSTTNAAESSNMAPPIAPPSGLTYAGMPVLFFCGQTPDGQLFTVPANQVDPRKQEQQSYSTIFANYSNFFSQTPPYPQPMKNPFQMESDSGSAAVGSGVAASTQISTISNILSSVHVQTKSSDLTARLGFKVEASSSGQQQQHSGPSYVPMSVQIKTEPSTAAEHPQLPQQTRQQPAASQQQECHGFSLMEWGEDDGEFLALCAEVGSEGFGLDNNQEASATSSATATATSPAFCGLDHQMDYDH